MNHIFKVQVIGIMACDENGVVGRNGVIPWYCSDEFRHFRNTIGNHPIIMGRKTFELIPKNILKNRTVIVFSRTKKRGVHEQEMLKQVQHDDKSKKKHHPEQTQHHPEHSIRHPELVSGSPLVSRHCEQPSCAAIYNKKNCIFISYLDDFFLLDIAKKEKKMFMIGGAKLANYFLDHNLISEFILTKMKKSYIGNAVLNIKAFDYWQSEIISRTLDYNIYKLTNK